MATPTPPAPDPIAAVTARLNPAQRPGARWMSGYARAKLRTDPLYRSVLPQIPPGTRVLDLGCGLGLLGLLLEARASGNSTWGIEWDAAKAGFGAQLAAEAGVSVHLIRGDLLIQPWPPCEVVTALDVLHYLSPPVQRKLLLRIGAHLPVGGRLILRVMDGQARGLARLTRTCERLAILLGWNRAERAHWRSLAAIQADIEAAGLVLPEEAGTGAAPASGNRLLLAEKRP